MINRRPILFPIFYLHFLSEGARKKMNVEQQLQSIYENDSTLTTLCIGHDQIGDEKAKYLAEALKVNTTLTTLDMTNNGIGDFV